MPNYIFNKPINKIIHGGDYNPEQWLDCPDILAKDIEFMKAAGINEATLGVFSWAMYEPTEGEFHFDWLKEIMDNLYKNGIYTILATPSGARPAWLDEKYPEVMRVDGMGIRNRHSFRHNHCLSSPKFREKIGIINRQLAEKFGDHPGLLMWHISNEFGGECFCDECKAKFQNHLRAKFHNDINELNHQWWTTFWSKRYTSFNQIMPPYYNGETCINGLNLEWKRFTSQNFADYMCHEIDTIRKYSKNPSVPVTTNMMGCFYDIDYRVLADKIDVISWDSYPQFHNDYESYHDTMMKAAFDNAVMRGLKKEKPFMLMESAPGQVNWQQYNKLKRPGVHKQFALQTIACGSDTIQYFQIRKSRGAAEQFHGAVIDHIGTNDTRVFKDVAETGEMLKRLSCLEGSVVKNKTAIIFEWENWWALDNAGGFSRMTKKYIPVCMAYYKKLLKMGVEADIISTRDSLEDYSLVIAPMLFSLTNNIAQKMKDFVSKGGILLGTYITGYVNENCLCYQGGFPGDGLTDLFGIISEEIDTLYPADKNEITFEDNSISAKNWLVKDYADLLRILDAEVLGKYTYDFYKDYPALTRKTYGKGKAYYQAARCNLDDMTDFFKILLKEAGIEQIEIPSGIEYHCRKSESQKFHFYLNTSEKEIELNNLSGTDLLTGNVIRGKFSLKPKENLILSE